MVPADFGLRHHTLGAGSSSGPCASIWALLYTLHRTVRRSSSPLLQAPALVELGLHAPVYSLACFLQPFLVQSGFPALLTICLLGLGSPCSYPLSGCEWTHCQCFRCYPALPSSHGGSLNVCCTEQALGLHCNLPVLGCLVERGGVEGA